MKILIAPNAFKGSLPVLEACRAFANGVKDALPKARIELMPISDGGDGLLDCLIHARGGRMIKARVTGPLGESRVAEYGMLPGKTAVIEMARASGLALVPEGRRDVLGATSYGTGELIAAALARGARTVIVGLGGSASNDGGAGLAQALGAKLLDAQGRTIGQGASELLRLARIDVSVLRKRLKGREIIAATDVDNPLLGPRGSARVYGPQKGATPAMVAVLERALRRYAAVIKRDAGHDVAGRAAAGAAGGAGAALIGLLGARVVAGAGYALRELGARRKLRGADGVLTGEGSVDRTSFFGKAPVEMARLALACGARVGFVCGRVDEPSRRRLGSLGITAVVSFKEAGAKSSDSMSRARHWARRAAVLAVKRMGLAAAMFALCGAAGAQNPQTPFLEVDGLYFHRNDGHNLDRTLSILAGLLEKNPDDAAALWREGRSLARMGESRPARREKLALFERAEGALKKSVALKPGEPEAHYWLGVAIGFRGQTRGLAHSLFLIGPIRREMEATLRLDPRHGGARHVLAEMLRQLPRFAGGSRRKALLEFEKAFSDWPDDAVCGVSLARAYADAGQKDKAREILGAVLSLKQPRDPAEYPDNSKEAGELLEKLAPAGL